jgi:biofilm protein TabA
VLVDTILHKDVHDRLDAGLREAIQFLQSADLASLTCGRHPIDGDRLYAAVSEYQTQSREEGRWEAHRRYMDVHVVVFGAEAIGYATAGALETVEEEPERDLVWLRGSGEIVTLLPGQFLAVWPGEGHMPGLAVGEPEPVKKVVVKVLDDRKR